MVKYKSDNVINVKNDYHYSVEKKSDVKSVETRKMALELYLEGLGFRTTGRVMKVSYVTVYYWAREWGEKVKLPKREEAIEIVELDGIHSYASQKKLLLDMDCC